MLDELEARPRKLAKALNVVGLMNVQFAIKDGDIYVLEVNPRASRTVPFVAKVIGKPIAKIAARIMAGEKLPKSFKLKKQKLNHIGVKEAVFPFARFPGVDTVLGPEMRSTGEVMGLSASTSSPPAAPSAISSQRACRQKRSTRCWKAAPTSSMP
jgi:carbamoyl-phosphate synthase large subunit